MKQILMKKLKKGDIFTYSVQLHNRRSFEVLENPIPEKIQTKCYDRVDCVGVKKTFKGYVILLKEQDNG